MWERIVGKVLSLESAAVISRDDFVAESLYVSQVLHNVLRLRLEGLQDNEYVWLRLHAHAKVINSV